MENKYLKNSYFADKNIKKNNTSEILYKYSKQSNSVHKNIKNYVNKFIENNL